MLSNGNTILLQISEILDDGASSAIEDYRLTLADGRALPEWLTKGTNGLIFAELPADVGSVDIKLSIALENGQTMTGFFTIHARTGEITDISKDQAPEQFSSLFSEQLTDTMKVQEEGFNNLANALTNM